MRFRHSECNRFLKMCRQAAHAASNAGSDARVLRMRAACALLASKRRKLPAIGFTGMGFTDQSGSRN